MGTLYAELFQALLDPFDASEVKVKPGAKGIKIQYVTARSVMNRLDKVLGPENWWDSYSHVTDTSALCALTIRLPDGSLLTKCDAGGAAGMADPGDDDKSIISDALKRAAVKFGVARYLYRDGTASYPESRDHVEPAHADLHDSDDRDSPRNGKALFKLLKGIEEERQIPLIKPLNDAARSKGLPGRMVDWETKDVEWAWRWAIGKAATSGRIPDAIPNDKALNALRHRLYDLAREGISVLHGPEFETLSEESRTVLVKQEINILLNDLSPGEVIESLADLKDLNQLEKLVELADRTLKSRRQVQEEGAGMGF